MKTDLQGKEHDQSKALKASLEVLLRQLLHMLLSVVWYSNVTSAQNLLTPNNISHANLSL